MAFIHLSNCFKEPKYLIRLLALILCVCVAMYQLSGCIAKVFHPPTTTHSSFKLNKTLKYPALTICRSPGYKMELFPKYGLIDVFDPSVTSFWKDFDFKQFTLEQFFAETTYNQEEVVPLHGFDGSLDALDIQEITKLTYGKCFKFTPKFLSTAWERSGGYSFYMMTQSRKRNVTTVNVKKPPIHLPPANPQIGLDLLFREQSKYGFHVFIHEHNERVADDGDQSDSFMEYIYVESEQQLSYSLSVTEYKNLPTADNDCRNDYNYSKSKCEEICLAEEVTKAVGCTTPWLQNENFPPCSTYDQTRDLIKTYNEYSKQENVNCNCPRSCNITIYMPHVAYQNKLDYGDQCAISLYYVTNLVTVTEEVAIYDWSLFLADLGGSLGFLLGLSVLGLISMIEQIGKICVSYKISKKTESTIQKDEKEAPEKFAKSDNQENENALVVWKEKTYFSLNDLYI